MDPLACLWGKTGLAGGGRSAVEAAEEALLIPVIGKAPTGVSRAMTGRVLADADTLAISGYNMHKKRWMISGLIPWLHFVHIHTQHTNRLVFAMVTKLPE